MYLHIGNGKLIKQEKIIGIFDFDTSTVTKKTKNWIAKKEKEKKVITISYELPKTFILMDDSEDNIVYLSQLSSKTLVSRTNTNRNKIKE